MSASFNLKDIGNSLNEASQKCEGKGVSFAGKSLKLNTEDDAKAVADAIKSCDKMEYLDLEGNTLGPDAAKAISTAIEENGTNLKRALWKDMFTGRMKDEIPVALQHLGRGLGVAGTQLVELDLSDNAFGPIGVKGLASLLSSSCCYTLQELRLNNNGLGITGGKLLAQALLDCHGKSLKDNGKPLSLKVFIAGRNRLENEGAQALAGVFEKLVSLEEVVMPQNGIYHVGISALAAGLSKNRGLRILNLNDNTVGAKGAKALAQALPNFSLLERLNLGDCLLKSEGAIYLAEALGIKGNHPALIEVNLGFNEIKSSAVTVLAAATVDKSNLQSLFLDGNEFGTAGKEELKDLLRDFNKLEALGTLDEDESNDEEEEEGRESTEEEEEEEDDKEEEKHEKSLINENGHVVKKKSINLPEFLKAPNGDNLLYLRENTPEDIIQYAKNKASAENTQFIDELMKIIMKISSNCDSGFMEVRVLAEKLTDSLYNEVFSYAVKNKQLPTLNNSLLVYLGLLKGEDKKRTQIDWNAEGCYKALEKMCQKPYFVPQTRDTLKVFVDRPLKTSRHTVDPLQESKDSLKAVLEKIQNA